MAPLYLNYYGLCMLNDNYEVKLHFAKIAFSNDQSYSSLGKHVFDVSIEVSNEANNLLHFFLFFLKSYSYFVSGSPIT